MTQYQRLGELMMARGILNQEQLEQALEAQKEKNERFGSVIVSLGFVTEQQLAECLAIQFDIPLADLGQLKPDPAVLKLLPPTFALSKLVLPVRAIDDRLHCVIADPLDYPVTDYLQTTLGRRLVISLAAPSELREQIAAWYKLPAKKAFVAPQTEDNATAPKKPRRKPKVDQQTDRADLLEALEKALSA